VHEKELALAGLALLSKVSALVLMAHAAFLKLELRINFELIKLREELVVNDVLELVKLALILDKEVLAQSRGRLFQLVEMSVLNALLVH
jgi:hypothetical protein